MTQHANRLTGPWVSGWMVHQVPSSQISRVRVSWSVNLLGKWEDLASHQALEMPYAQEQGDRDQEDESTQVVDEEDARQKYEDMLMQFGGVKEGVKRPQHMAQRAPKRK